MKNKLKPETMLLILIPILFAAGALMHALYEICGECFAVGLFAPVNESVFEHIKLIPLPLFAGWGIFYLFRRDDIDANSYFTAMLLSALVSSLLVPVLYYFYTGAFGGESMVVDILLLLIALTAGQTLGRHYYLHKKGLEPWQSLVLFVLFIVLIALLTAFPPKLPLFADIQTGQYGMN
ncbi:MAG TPA: DUF6512 family protein [Bacillota bacterium]|nr:DUF6512 family protein [Bacillota bacterium]